MALKIIATMFRDADWDDIGLFDIIKPINDFKKLWNATGNNDPKEIVNPPKFAKYQKVIPVSMFNEPKMHKVFEDYFFESLFWGLNNPDDFIKFFKENEKRQNDRLSEYKKAGLKIDSIPTLDNYLKDGDKIISS